MQYTITGAHEVSPELRSLAIARERAFPAFGPRKRKGRFRNHAANLLHRPDSFASASSCRDERQQAACRRER